MRAIVDLSATATILSKLFQMPPLHKLFSGVMAKTALKCIFGHVRSSRLKPAFAVCLAAFLASASGAVPEFKSIVYANYKRWGDILNGLKSVFL